MNRGEYHDIPFRHLKNKKKSDVQNEYLNIINLIIKNCIYLVPFISCNIYYIFLCSLYLLEMILNNEYEI